MNSKPFTRVLLAAIAGLAVLTAIGCSDRLSSEPSGKATFDGASTDLEQTQIVATLDEPIAPGNNVIWCASFQAAWKELEKDVVKGPISLDGGGQQVDALNAAADPRPTIPKDCLVAAAGWNNKGIVKKICAELAKRFPAKTPPSFPGIASDSFVAYAYLEANIPFAIPFFQNREPLVFKDANGNASDVQSFGIRKEDDYAYDNLRYQAEVIYISRDTGQSEGDHYQLAEFAVDLDRNSQPNQIVVAVIEPKESLAETFSSLEEKIAASQTSEKKEHMLREIGPNDVLLVPDMCWRLTHHFAGLEKKAFNNKNLSGQRMDVAQQDIMFRLDRSGAEIQSEAKDYCKPMPTYFVADRPFLVYMKKRGADVPYFAMWIANAELLTPWDGKRTVKKNKNTKNAKKAKPNAKPAETAKRPANWARPIEIEGVPNLHKVSDSLYRSAQPTAQGMKNLKEKLGIKTIVNLRSFHGDRDEMGKTGLGYEHIYMKAWHPEKKEAVRFLEIVTDPARQPVLVHCQHGADRTGTMCALYRIAVQGWTKEAAIKEMRDGGFHFHKVWTNLPEWIESLDMEKIKQRAGMDEKEKEPRMNTDEHR